MHTVLERVMETISFEASERSGERVEINAEYVKGKVKDLLEATDLKKYII